MQVICGERCGAVRRGRGVGDGTKGAVEDAAHQRAEQDERERFRVWDARRLEREGQRERRRLRLPRHHRPKGGPHVGPHQLHRLAEALDRKVAANVRRLREGSRRQVGSAAVGGARWACWAHAHLLCAPILPPRHILGARRLLGLVREHRVLVAARDERPRRPAHEFLGDGLEAHRRVAAVAVVAAVLPRVLAQDARARQPECAALRRRQQPQPPAARELWRHRRATDHEAPLLVAARARRVARVRMGMGGRYGGRGGRRASRTGSSSNASNS